jgi:ATP-dependent DNA helicase PIF1
MELSREQQLIFDKYVCGENIFMTGPGGSGKSALIRIIYEHALNEVKKSDAIRSEVKTKVRVCAMTGCAALLLNCNATTIHSFAGIGIGNKPIDELVQKVKKNKFARTTWRETKLLIVDEVSMMSMDLFDTLNQIGKSLRNCELPFGGIQVIFSGDFYQLPPVAKTVVYCFESADWNTVFPNQIELSRVYRQTDNAYASILNQIRIGRIKRSSHETLMQYVRGPPPDDIVVTKLYPTKSQVDMINSAHMAALETEERVYTQTFKLGKQQKSVEVQYELEHIANNMLCEKVVRVKVGAQVMSVVNIQTDNTLEICNGSQGIVTGFAGDLPRVKFNNGIEMVMSRHVWTSEKILGVGVAQIPLILAWALTIHKSQGATLDYAEIDVGSGIFEVGQTYVALSRVKSLEGLYLSSYDPSKIKISRKVMEYYATMT